ncbi:MAG: thioredoxin family protein [Flavobacteriaceae bacterium]|nr:thioredoxin family protein [Flavobacteriaceae bacterium]
MDMFRFLVLILFFSLDLVFSQDIKWMSLEKALEAQKVIPKKIIMDVYTTWCGPCRLLDKKTFGNPDVSRYISQYFYAVKFNAEGDEEIFFYDKKFSNPNYNPDRKGRNSTHDFTKFLGIKGYPTIIFFSEEGDPIIPLTGYFNVRQIEPYLKMIKRGDYAVFKDSDDIERYIENFAYRFRQ